MGQYRVSDLNIEVNTKSQTLQGFLKPYETSFDYKPNLSLSITDDILLQLMDEYEGYTADVIECEYLATEYCRALYDFNGFPISATAVEYNDCAVLFSSPYEHIPVNEYFPQQNIFSDGNVAVRLISSVFYAYGTPFSLKGDASQDKKIPIRSIVFVDSERFDSLKRLETKDMVAMFMSAVMQSIRNERTKHTLYILEKLMHVVDFYGVADVRDAKFILDRVTE